MIQTKNMLKVIRSLIIIGIFHLLITSTVFGEGTFTSHSYGGKTYKLYVPSSYHTSEPFSLVVMLHGCTQDANQFAAGTEMNTIAERESFIVLYPEQTSSANSSRCWNWFETGHQARGSGEPAVIAGMVQQVKNNFAIDSDNVFVTGLSAGGAMSVIMGATYPDVFSAIGVAAGLEYKAATNSIQAFTAMSSGGPNPKTQGTLAYNAMGQYKQVMPTIVFHGTSDYTVQPINGDQVISQWAKTNDLAYGGVENTYINDTPNQTKQGQVSGGRSYTNYIYQDKYGITILEKYLVNGMGHAWSGGSTQGSYTDPNGPNASELMWQFFMQERGEQDPNEDDPGEGAPPMTTASPKGGTYTSPVSVTLQTNREAKTYYTVDGTTPDENSPVYSEPIFIENSSTLRFYSVDSNGLSEELRSEDYMITEAANEVILSSIAQEDGFVGRFSADGLSTSILKVGDKGMYNTDTYRTILSFDTSSLSSTHTIKGAKLRVYRKALQGNVQTMDVDMKVNAFGTSSSLESIDYSSAATYSNLLTAQVPSQDHQFVDFELPSHVLKEIASNNKLQFRIKSATTASFTSNVLEIHGGEHADYAPQLIVIKD
ncbi:PHB depolymerase family esterase [Alkalihalophilus pseudofirmus]|uniref:PHB depolymerase family esterase n=1 Tax=Alkalihalophilus pseudofirmus TaxID=79885 RepID=A0AAJ2NP50_ALKPS|nr:PHB depolymerase family esterase [Alkalihalophilus pseudofirmus]MDV2885994.1 PHB depolymerase family esterase [Alkalihalophilus pseudofirmus]